MALKFHAADTIAKGGVADNGADHLPGAYEHIDLYYAVTFGAGAASLVLAVQVSDDGGTTWRTVSMRDLTTTGGNYVASKTLTSDGTGVLRLESQGRQVRVTATHTGDNDATLTVEGFVTR
jgi:hypothetical protein